MSTIDALKSMIGKHGGLHAGNRFKVLFTPPGNGGLSGEELTLSCEAVQIPGQQITTFEYPYNAIEQLVKVPNGYLNEDVVMTFLLTNDFSIKKTFDAWRKEIITDKYLLKYAADYETDITIIALDQKNTERYRMKLIGAFPITVGSIQLSNASKDEYAKLEVTFSCIDIEPA